MMFLPPELTFLEPVLYMAVIVFVVDLIGNMLSFSNRILNAFVTALVFTVVAGGVIYAVNEVGGPVPTISQTSTST